MTDCAEKIYQLWVKLSLELNVIETNWFFSAEKGVGHKKDPMGYENVTKGSQSWGSSLPPSRMGVPPPPPPRRIGFPSWSLFLVYLVTLNDAKCWPLTLVCLEVEKGGQVWSIMPPSSQMHKSIYQTLQNVSTLILPTLIKGYYNMPAFCQQVLYHQYIWLNRVILLC